MEMRFEAWTRPETGTFERLFPLPKLTEWAMTLGVFGQGRIALPKDYPRLDEILFTDPSNRANDKATMIRAYWGDKHVYDFYASRMSIDVNVATGTRVAAVTGGGPGTVLDRTKVRQVDYDANPPLEPDWIYGGDNTILVNGDFEDGSANGLVNGSFEEGLVEPWTELSGVDTNPLDADMETTDAESYDGSYSLQINPGKRHSGALQTITCTPGVELTLNGFLKCNTVGRRFTCDVRVEDGMTLDASNNGYVWNGWYIVELGNVTRNGSTGLPGGKSDGTWQALGQIKVTPGPEQTSLKYIVIYDHHDNTNGPIFYIDGFTATGLGVGLDPWQRYLLTTMEVTTVDVYSGTQAALVGGPDGAAFYQNIEGLEVGRRYTTTHYVRQDSGAAKDIAVQYTIPGSPSSAILVTETIPDDNEYHPIKVSWIATQSTARVETKNMSGGALTWRVGLAKVAGGFGADTYGKIMGDLRDDAVANHAPDRTALAHLIPTFTPTLDSNGDQWDQDVAITVSRGQPYRRVVSFMADGFGYETRIRPKPTDDTILWLDLFNPEGMGYDYTTGDGGAVTKHGLVSIGPIIRREPSATYAMAEGELLRWWEDRNTVLEGVWGEIEAYHGTDEISSVSLAPVVAKMVSGDGGETMVASFQGPNLVPGVDYVLGDTVRLVFGDDLLPAAAYRCVAITIESGSPKPTFQVQYEQAV